MKEQTPRHDDIALKAHTLWKDRGCPEGIDCEIWFEAERQVRDEFTRRAQDEAAAESRSEFNLPASMPDQQAIKAAMERPVPRPNRAVKSFTGSTRKGGSGQSGLGRG
jgi:hypothetical protein